MIEKKQEFDDQQNLYNELLIYIVRNFYTYDEIIRIDGVILQDMSLLNKGTRKMTEVSARTLKYIADNRDDNSLFARQFFQSHGIGIMEKQKLEYKKVNELIGYICDDADNDVAYQIHKMYHLPVTNIS